MVWQWYFKRHRRSTAFILAGTPTHTPGLVDWVSGRRPHSQLPQSQRASHPVNATRLANPKQPPASVGRRTDTRSTSPTRPQARNYTNTMSLKSPG
jgi:hypothetical protein